MAFISFLLLINMYDFHFHVFFYFAVFLRRGEENLVLEIPAGAQLRGGGGCLDPSPYYLYIITISILIFTKIN